MVISSVDQQILSSIAAVDGIHCGLAGIVDQTGMDYRHAHRRLHRLTELGLVSVDRRGKGRRMIIRLEAAALLLTLCAGNTRGGVPVCVFSSSRITDHKNG